ncbi:hypothetical protein ACXIUS_24650 [Bosea thiooxidans]
MSSSKLRVQLRWEKRSPQDFEFFAVKELAPRYDLIVIGHSHAGRVARESCFSAEQRAMLGGSVGLSYRNYAFDGRPWALPLGAAT